MCILGAELLNTALENLADKVQPDEDEQIGILKDFAAAAIFIIGLGAFTLWSILTFF
jgi:diacylglycerol kinase (ATP)